MIKRNLKVILENSLKKFPVVGLVGARQVGKTTVARALEAERPGETLYLDLERPSDLARLEEAELYLEGHAKELVILDEIQRRPDLFSLLRALVDSERRNGRFLILGSASPDLMRSASESLAGRIIYHELSPFCLSEVGNDTETRNCLWRRGGYPTSFLANSEEDSLQWRLAFIQTHLERDIPSLGFHIQSMALRRFWSMLAYCHGQLWNASKIAGSLGVTGPTVKYYLDVLESTFMIRRLPPLFANVKKRLVKRPKVYLRDSGLLHALLRINSEEELLGHPSAGVSWEGWIIEQISALLPSSWDLFFYRTSAGAEIDLVIEGPTKTRIAVEIKRTLQPRLTKGFRSAFSDLAIEQGYFVYSGKERYPLAENVHALPVAGLEQIVSMGERH